MPGPPIARDEDELERLPPLDGGAGDEPEGVPENEGLTEEPEQDAGADDATGEDDPVDASELGLDEGESGWLGEPPDAPNLDVGSEVPVGEESSESRVDDAEDAGGAEWDFGLADGAERAGLDTGDEGPVDADEELHERDLPALDADDEGDLDERTLVDDRFASDELLGLPWAAEPWSPVGAPFAIQRATAVACAARGALVASRSEPGVGELLRVDLEGARQPLSAEGLAAGEIGALVGDASELVVVMRDGRMFSSRDAGARFEPLAQGVSAADAAMSGGVYWVRTRAGALLARGPADEPLARCPVPGPVAAIAGDGAGLAALVVEDSGRPTALLRVAPGGAIGREAVEAPGAGSPLPLAARGVVVAYAGRTGVVRRAPDGAWRWFTWGGSVTALVLLDDAGTVLAATYSEADDTTGLVRLDAAGHASIVARIGASPEDVESDGRVLAMAFDEPRGVVWVAGGFGLLAFAVR